MARVMEDVFKSSLGRPGITLCGNNLVWSAFEEEYPPESSHRMLAKRDRIVKNKEENFIKKWKCRRLIQ